MLAYLRHHQKSILLVVTVVVCITFGWFYVVSDTGSDQGSAALGKIYGRNITVREYKHMENHLNVAMQFQLPGFEQLAADSTRDNFMPYVASVHMVREEAARLGLATTEPEIENHIRTIPAFQTNGIFDADKFRQYAGTGSDDGLLVQHMNRYSGQMENSGPFKLSRLGLSVADFYKIIGDYMLFAKLTDLLGVGLAMSDLEGQRNYSLYNQQITASTIAFPLANYKEAVKLTSEEIKKAYEDQKNSRFMTQEKKSISYVAIAPEKAAELAPPPPAADGKPAEAPASPAEAPEKAKARAQLVDRIFNALGDGRDFESVAKENNLTLVTTQPFAAFEPPDDLKDKNNLQSSVSRLTTDRPIATPFKEGDTWYVVRLKELLAPQPKPLAEVEGELKEELTTGKAREAATKAAKEAAARISPLLKAGKSFTDAAKDAGLTATTLPVITNESVNANPSNRLIRTALQLLPPGSLGEPVNDTEAVLLPFLDKREITRSNEKAADIARMSEYGTQMLRRTVFTEWWNNRRAAAGFTDNTRKTP